MAKGVQDLEAWTVPVLDVMGGRTRRNREPLWRHGLLGPGEHKGIQPIAERLGLPGPDQPQYGVASPAGDNGPLLRTRAMAQVPGFAMAWTPGGCAGPWASCCGPKRSTAPACQRRLPRRGPARPPPARSPVRRKQCWPAPPDSA